MGVTITKAYSCDRCGRIPLESIDYDFRRYGWGILSIQQADELGMGHNGFFSPCVLCNECRDALLRFLKNEN